MSPRSVVVVHREAMVAESIAAALARYPRLLAIAVAMTVEEGEACAQQADAVVIDQQIACAEESAHRLRQRGVRAVMLGDHDAGDGVRVSPRASVVSLVSALCPGYFDVGFKAGDSRAASLGSLTAREREILALVARGMAAKQVARHLGISPKTVEQHKTRMFSKLGVPNQAAAVCVALVAGLESTQLFRTALERPRRETTGSRGVTRGPA